VALVPLARADQSVMGWAAPAERTGSRMRAGDNSVTPIVRCISEPVRNKLHCP
jgi:hypothetical protein